MGSGTDVARESASVVLLGNNLFRFAEVLKIARRCRRIIMANFAGTIAVDSAGVILAAFGFLNRSFGFSIPTVDVDILVAYAIVVYALINFPIGVGLILISWLYPQSPAAPGPSNGRPGDADELSLTLNWNESCK